MTFTPGQCRLCNRPTPNRDDWYCTTCRRPVAKPKPERDSGWSGPTAMNLTQTLAMARRLGVPVYRTTPGTLPVRINQEAA